MMLDLDGAVDEYLHAIVRTRPWTVKRETMIFEAFGDWLYAQPDLSAELEAITRLVIHQYAAQRGLSDRDRDDVEAAVDRLRGWVGARGLAEYKRAAKLATS